MFHGQCWREHVHVDDYSSEGFILKQKLTFGGKLHTLTLNNMNHCNWRYPPRDTLYIGSFFGLTCELQSLYSTPHCNTDLDINYRVAHNCLTMEFYNGIIEK